MECESRSLLSALSKSPEFKENIDGTVGALARESTGEVFEARCSSAGTAEAWRDIAGLRTALLAAKERPVVLCQAVGANEGRLWRVASGDTEMRRFLLLVSVSVPSSRRDERVALGA